MRDILFRGKKVETGEWIYGNLLHTDNGTYIIQNIPKQKIDNYKVFPETICEYSGIDNILGIRIFENDIIQYLGNYIGDYCFKAKVVFENGGFEINIIGGKYKGPLKGMENRIDIIGNIFDNPELLMDE